MLTARDTTNTADDTWLPTIPEADRERERRHKGHLHKIRTLSNSLPSLLPSIPNTLQSHPRERKYMKISFSMKFSQDLKPAPAASQITFPALKRHKTVLNPLSKVKNKKKVDTALKVVNTSNRTVTYSEENGDYKCVIDTEGKTAAKARPNWDRNCHCAKCQDMAERWNHRDDYTKAPQHWEKPQTRAVRFRRRNYAYISKTWDGSDPLT